MKFEIGLHGVAGGSKKLNCPHRDDRAMMDVSQKEVERKRVGIDGHP